MNVKQKGSKSLGYWTNYVAFPFNHTHDLHLELKVKTLNSLISGMGGLIDMEQK